MTREERCLLAIERGYTYNPETGNIYSRFGKLIKYKNLGYIVLCLSVNKKTYHIGGHQFAWYWVYKECVDCLDHINRVRNDNRISNLRSVTHSQNMFNYNAKGYSYHKRLNKFCSHIQFNKKRMNLGCYKTEEEARNAYLQAKEKYHII